MTIQIAPTPKQLKKSKSMVMALLAQGISLEVVNQVTGKDRY